MEIYPGIRKMFRYTTGFDSDDFLVIFKYLNTGLNCENAKFFDIQTKREHKKYTQTAKPGMKVKFSVTGQFFMQLSWLRNGFTMTINSWLFRIPKSSVSICYILYRQTHILYHMNKFTIFFPWENCIVIWPSGNQVLETMPETFKTSYCSTRCIKDCIKIFCQKPSSLSSQTSLY